MAEGIRLCYLNGLSRAVERTGSFYTIPPGGRSRGYIKAVTDPSTSDFHTQETSNTTRPSSQPNNSIVLDPATLTKHVISEQDIGSRLTCSQPIMCYWNHVKYSCGCKKDYRCYQYCYVAGRRYVELGLYESASGKSKSYVKGARSLNVRALTQ